MILVITGSKLRHLFFACKILQKFPAAKVLIEKHPESSFGAHLENASSIQASHFDDFAKTEKKYFEDSIDYDLLKSRTLATIESGDINSDNIINLIKKIAPNGIFTYSPSLLKKNFIDTFGKIINLHAGLSPYYRGSGTNVFPFINDELEYVGMTVHYIDQGIDSGEIILQGRPEFEIGDNTHTIGCKNVILGAELVCKVIEYFEINGFPPSYPQDLSIGKLYLKKDFTDEVILKLKDVSDTIALYIKNNPKKISIVEEIKCSK